MAWFGDITHFDLTNNAWEVSVNYYNELTPQIVFPRKLTLPLMVTKTEAVAAIQARGAEVRRSVSLTDEKFVGQTIPIPVDRLRSPAVYTESMPVVSSYPLHAVGSTGNSSSAAKDVGSDADNVCLEVVIEAVGGTPTVSVALEGSMDGTNFVSVRVVPTDSETAASLVAYTSTGRKYLFMKNDLGQFFRFFRCTTSANTNVTYSTNLFVLDSD